MKQCGIMGVFVFTTTTDESLPNATEAQIVFTDDWMYQVTNANRENSRLANWPTVGFYFVKGCLKQRMWRSKKVTK